MRRNKNILRLIWLAIIGALLFTSCKKTSSSIAPDPFYTVAVNGLSVVFNNQSRNAASYIWDFGDGSASKDASPTHIYAAKGKYVPTLYATNANGVTKEASTVLHISKGSAIKMDDNSLSDWDTVSTNVVTAGPKAGNFIKAKYDYDGNNVYVYFEQYAKKSDGDIYDLYIDADNDMTTGYLTGDIPNGAYEVLLEGSIFGNWLDPFYFAGAQTGFNYVNAGISDFYTVGTYQESGGVLKFEFALKRSKIKNLTGQAMKIGVQVSKADWSATIGYSPDQGSNAFFLDMSQ